MTGLDIKNSNDPFQGSDDLGLSTHSGHPLDFELDFLQTE
jgi:hypothetical protein